MSPTNNRLSQGSAPSSDVIQVQGSAKFEIPVSFRGTFEFQGADHGQFQGGEKGQFQGGEKGQFQGGEKGQFQGADHENNQGADQGQFHKVVPLIGIPVGRPVDPQNKFNDHTDMPFTGARDHQAGVTHQPMMPVVHPIEVNRVGQGKSA